MTIEVSVAATAPVSDEVAAATVASAGLDVLAASPVSDLADAPFLVPFFVAFFLPLSFAGRGNTTRQLVSRWAPQAQSEIYLPQLI